MRTAIRHAINRVPVLGPALKSVYLSLVAGEGRIRTIKKGVLTGAKYYHYRWSTPTPDLVETNWADEMPACFIKEIAGKKRFFDVGANWGFYVLLAARHRDPGCEIVAFEPHPRSARELNTQIQLNRISNAQVVQSAVSNQQGIIEFADTGSAIGQKLASVNDSHANAQHIQVPTTTLDAATEKFGPPDLIKLDIEGAEILALKGATKLLATHKPTILIEIHTPELAEQFYDLMEPHKYKYFTTQGQQVTTRAYHHHLVCKPTP